MGRFGTGLFEPAASHAIQSASSLPLIQEWPFAHLKWTKMNSPKSLRADVHSQIVLDVIFLALEALTDPSSSTTDTETESLKALHCLGSS